MPVYGTCENVCNWLYVDDYAGVLLEAVMLGETYNLGVHNEKQNIEVVYTMCDTLNISVPKEINYRDQISFLTDRLGNDFRFAIVASKITRELG